MNRLYQNEHRAAFLEFAKNDPMYRLEQAEFQSAMEKLPDEERYIYDNTYLIYRQFGDKSLLACDYCRMINILCTGYIAGYYTEEALDRPLKISLELQEAYSSWDDLYRNYLAGFHFWQPGDMGDTGSENFVRLMIRSTLQREADGPYSMLWDTALAPDWYAVGV